MGRGGHNFIDLTNQKFGELKVLTYNKGTKRIPSTWTCLCSCGEIIKVPGYALRQGNYKSCGCQHTSKRNAGVKRHIERDRVAGTRKSALKQKVHKDSTSGVRGVYWVKSRERWLVKIMIAGETHHIGYFKELDEAISARKKAEEKYHKPFLEETDEH